MKPSVINPEWLKSLGQKPFFKRIAALAGYTAAKATRSRDSATRIGTNTNSTYSQMERIQLQWDGQYVGKNSPIGRAYLSVRQMYCNPKAYMPTTGDSVLDDELKDYLEGVWKNGGINCSMWEAFGRSANVEQPCGGDSALIWYRDETQLRLQEACSDQIGELYSYTRAYESLAGMVYFAGMFFNPLNGQRLAFKIYDRGWNDYYTNPQVHPQSDVIYFQDNLFKAIRGVTEFSAVIDNIYKSDKLFQTGMDSAERQAKVQAVVFNRGGQAESYSYDDDLSSDGDLTYVEKSGYGGPITEFKYVGDDYKLINAVAPGPELIQGCQYADEKTALGLRLPYSFLINAKDVGGASNRLEINKAGHELERIQKCLTPRLQIISYITIMDAVDRGIFRPIPRITEGMWQFPNLPIADAFREDKADIESVRAGTKSRGDVTAQSGRTFSQVVRKKKEEAVEIHKAVAEANAELEALKLPATITKADIAQDSDSPQAAPVDQNQAQEPEKPVIPARMAAYMGDVTVADLPESTQTEIASILGTNGSTGSIKVIKYGMTVSELLKMADPDNLEAARKRLRYCTNGACSDEVHANSEKHVIVQNGRVIDGHHWLARAEKGKVSKSLQVIDISPARFQSPA